jgi:hypothetical protein
LVISDFLAVAERLLGGCWAAVGAERSGCWERTYARKHTKRCFTE